MLTRLKDWLRQRQSPRFSYVAHEYLKDTWVCTLCRKPVHVVGLEKHAQATHDFRGHIELTPHALKPGVSFMSQEDSDYVARELDRRFRRGERHEV